MWWALIVTLALGTWALRVIGPVAGDLLTPSPRVERLAGAAATVLMVALVVLSAIGTEHGISPARLLGVGLAMILSWRGAPLGWVVVVAVAVTAGLRALGLG